MLGRLKGNSLIVVLAALAVSAQLVLLLARGTASVVSGDEGTFLAMTESLAIDGDLAFTESDAARLERHEEAGRRAVILQRTESGIAYSKPALFPLLAAPWYRLLGEPGIVGLNAVALAIAIALAWGFLDRRTGSRYVGVAVVSFVGSGVLLSYVAWAMSDSLQASLVMGGMAMALGGSRSASSGRLLDRFFASPWSTILGSALLALAAAMRFPNLLLALAVPLALAWQRRWGRGLLSVLVIVVTFACALLANDLLTGAAVPYKAERATFNAMTGYPAGEGTQERVQQFVSARATHRLGAVPSVRPLVSLHAAAYFFIGRHTGLLLYAVASAFFALAAVRRRDPVGWAVVLAAVAMAVFYVLWMPRNYFGGGTFLGNRYFLTAQAALLLAPVRLPGVRSLAAVWAVATVVFFSALTSSIANRETDGTSQMHAHAGIFRLLPYESTATELDGRRDRYWSDELVRFVDPYATVGAQGFKLAAGDPPAEIVTASGRGHGVVRLLVQADVPVVDFVYRDWLKTKRFRLTEPPDGGGAAGARGFIEVVPSPAIRRHPFWWDETARLKVRSMRLQLTTPDGSPAKAEVRYAGPYRFVPRFYRGEIEALRIPGRGSPRGERKIPLRLRNTGARYWATDDPIPIFVSYRVFRLPRDRGDAILYGPLTPLPERVDPKTAADLRMSFVMPEEEGQYEVVVDLVVAGLSWFEEWNGRPLMSGKLRVRSGARDAG